MRFGEMTMYASFKFIGVLFSLPRAFTATVRSPVRKTNFISASSSK